jgi:general secretion pathway protein C
MLLTPTPSLYEIVSLSPSRRAAAPVCQVGARASPVQRAKQQNSEAWWKNEHWHEFGYGSRFMVSQGLLKGCFGCVVLGLLASSAYFQATAVSRLMACAIGNAPKAPRSSTQRPARPPPPAIAAPLLERNAFDSQTGSLVERPVTSEVDDLADPLAAPVCDSPRLYIVSESDDKSWSMATLQGADELRPRTRRIGDEVANKRVEYIGFNPRRSTPAVWLSSGRALCQAVLFGSNSSERVERVQRASERPSSLAADPPERLRIVPELKAGKLVGVRLFGIQPKGAFAAIGLQNGDRLEAINGLAMNSPEHALELYAMMRTVSDFDLRIARRGRPLSISLHLK